MAHPLLAVLATTSVLQQWQNTTSPNDLRLWSHADSRGRLAPSRRLSFVSRPAVQHQFAQQSSAIALSQRLYQAKFMAVSRATAAFAKNPWNELVVRGPATDVGTDEPQFNLGGIATVTLGTYGIGLVSLLIGNAYHLPNMGFGKGIVIDAATVRFGLAAIAPLLGLNLVMECFKDDVPEIARVSNTTKGLILQLCGAKRSVYKTFIAALAIGIAAGVNEELAFRGVLQTLIAAKTNLGDMGALWLSAAVFGVLHAATPLYAIFAGIAGAYFGWLFLVTGNTIVPIISHAVFDIISLIWAHLLVTQMPRHERLELFQWSQPASLKQVANELGEKTPTDKA